MSKIERAQRRFDKKVQAAVDLLTEEMFQKVTLLNRMEECQLPAAQPLEKTEAVQKLIRQASFALNDVKRYKAAERKRRRWSSPNYGAQW